MEPVRVLATLLLASCCGLVARAEDGSAAALLGEIIRIDTSNPPGQTEPLARLLESKFQPLGFAVELVPTPYAGRVHFLARLKGDGSKRPVLLAAHSDVVGVERKNWTVDPFAGLRKDGFVYGRGAIDFKGGLAVFATALMRVAREKIPLARDIIFLSEPDEEGAGPAGTPWLAANHWDKIDCEFALNEGGWIMKRPNGTVRYVAISVADKTSINLFLTAHGTSTHSSMPRPDNAIYALGRALAKLSQWEPAPRLLPATRQFFETLARTGQPPLSQYFHDIASSNDPAVIARADREIARSGPDAPLLHAFLRDTLAPVILKAGFRENVIPSTAEAQINVRVLPGSDAEALRREVERVVGDPTVEVRLDAKRLAQGTPPPSPLDTDLYRALARSAKQVFPEAEVTPYLFQAGTDAAPWRRKGVPVYGIYPYPIDDEDLKRMHGNDERVEIRSLAQGTEMVYRTLVSVAGK